MNIYYLREYIILLYCYVVILLCCYIVILLYCYVVILCYCYVVMLLYCYIVILLCCYVVMLLYCYVVILLYCYIVILLCCYIVLMLYYLVTFNNFYLKVELDNSYLYQLELLMWARMKREILEKMQSMLYLFSKTLTLSTAKIKWPHCPCNIISWLYYKCKQY